MQSLVEEIASYVPTPVLGRAARHSSPPVAPLRDSALAAVLFADVSGYTVLAERLVREGPAGVENLSDVVNRHFARLIAIVEAHGGETVTFAGDALLACWSCEALGEDLATASWRATQCAAAVEAELNDREVDNGIRLFLRQGIGAGESALLHVGGQQSHWVFLLAGESVVQSSDALRQAQSGEVVLAPSVAEIVGSHAVVESLESGYYRLISVDPPGPLGPRPPLALAADFNSAIRPYVPPAVLTRLDAGQGHWLAELRRITVIFANVIGLSGVVEEAEIERYHAVTGAVQTVVDRFDGTINRIVLDDKGLVVVAVWGIPLVAHEDDPGRAVQAALALQDDLRRLGVIGRIGIATGTAFCGAVGGVSRREYTVMGDRVNLAARLMQTATDILCDTQTQQAAARHVSFESLPAIVVRGSTEAVPVFRPREVISAARRQRAPVGRAPERSLIERRLAALCEGAGGTVLLEGEPGMGKSTLVDDLSRRAREIDVVALVGVADPINRSRSYAAWRPMFQDLFHLSALPEDPGLRRDAVIARLPPSAVAAVPGCSSVDQLGPFLNPVLPLDWVENDLSASFAEEARAHATRELLIQILLAASESRPTLVVLEDAHWLDSASWSLLWLASRRVQRMLLVVTTRPLDEPVPAEYRFVRQEAQTVHLVLDAMPLEDVVRLVCERLEVSALPGPVVRLIQERAQGNPFYSEELALALRDAGLITLSEGTCRIAPSVDNLVAAAASLLPDTLQGVITSRVDRLTPSQQSLLKVASVIGHEFPLRVFQEAYADETSPDQLLADLIDLERRHVLRAIHDEPDSVYGFRHAVTRDVAYSLMPYATRRRLHRAAAEWYERAYAEDPRNGAPLLAHHWDNAIASPATETELIEKALTYIERAAEEAARSYANAEVIHLLTEALRLANVAGPPVVKPRRRAHWEMRLGEAHANVGNLKEAREHLQVCLDLLDLPVPSAAPLLAGATFLEIVRQGIYRLPLLDRPAVHSADRARTIETAARAYRHLGDVAFLSGQLLASAHAHLRALNLAERIAPSPELAYGCAAVGLMAGAMALPKVADSYFARSIAAGDSVGGRESLAYVWLSRGLDLHGRGDCDGADEAFGRAADMYARLGNPRWRELALINKSLAQYWLGEFRDALENLDVAYRSGWERGDLQIQVWLTSSKLNVLTSMGRLDEAIAGFDEVDRLVAGSLEMVSNPSQTLGFLAGRARAWARRGDWQRALEFAQTAQRTAREVSDFAYYLLPSQSDLAEVGLRLALVRDAETGLDLARTALKTMRALSRVYPICRPTTRIWQATFDWLTGKRASAIKQWQGALDAAEKLRLPRECALAHFEAGHHLPAESPERRRHLEAAIEILQQIDAAYDLRLARAALDGISGPDLFNLAP